MKKVVTMENHLRATHKITDNVLYKKYLRAAMSESSVDPIADDGLLDVTTDQEEKRYQDFMKTCLKYPKEGIQLTRERVLTRKSYIQSDASKVTFN